MHKLCDLGVWIYVSSKVLSADGENLKVQFKNNTFDLPYDTVIIATGYVSELSLKEKLEKAGIKVMAIGDCLQPGKIINAIRAAVDVVQSLE